MPKQTFLNLPAEKRDRIVDVAITEFLEYDFQGASISRICTNAGIPKGSFYQYFDGKEDLYLHLFELMATAKREFLSGNIPDPEQDIYVYLRRLAEIGVEFELTYPRLSELGYQATAGNSLPAGFEKQMKQESLVYFRYLIALGKEQGKIGQQIDEELAAFIVNTIFGELGRFLMQQAELDDYRPGEGQSLFNSPDVQSLLDQTFEFLENGLQGTQ